MKARSAQYASWGFTAVDSVTSRSVGLSERVWRPAAATVATGGSNSDKDPPIGPGVACGRSPDNAAGNGRWRVYLIGVRRPGGEAARGRVHDALPDT